MSLRRKAVEVVHLNPKEQQKLEELSAVQRSAEAMGLTPDQIKRMQLAEERVFIPKGTNKGKELVGGECNLVPIPIPPSVGVGIVDPITCEPIGVISKGNLYNMDGSPHPATLKYLGR